VPGLLVWFRSASLAQVVDHIEPGCVPAGSGLARLSPRVGSTNYPQRVALRRTTHWG